MNEKTCENCISGHDVGLSSYRRECRRHAPATAPGHGVLPPAQWPIVGNSDWCGDFEAKPVVRTPRLAERLSSGNWKAPT